MSIDATTGDAIDIYNQWLLKATTDAGSGSSHRCWIMSGSSSTLMIPTMTYAEIYGLRVWMVGDVWVWKWRYGGQDDFWMVSCFSLLFFSSLNLRPVQMASACDCNTVGVSQVEVDFPRGPDLPKGCQWGVPISRGTYRFVRFRT